MENEEEKLTNSLVSIAIESWRLQSVFNKVLSKLDMDDRKKYQSQFLWFSKKVNNALNEAEIKTVNLEGQKYDPGMAVTALNCDEFDTDDELIVVQTIEPIVMKKDVLLKTGTVVLGKELK